MSSSKKEQSPEPPSLIQLLPEDIIIDILSRVRWCDYRTLSLVSKHFRSLVASHELYARRSLLGCTVRRLYVALSNRETTSHNPYILCLEANDNHRLVLIPWPTHVPHVGSFVTVGWKLYAFDMLNRYHHLPIPSIDCRFQTVHLVHCMNATMDVSVAGVIDGKIYMYTRDGRNSFVYDPKESKWETDKRLNMFKWQGGCVVDDVLYYFDNRGGKVLRAYNPRKSSWVVVKGLERLVAEGRFSESYYTGSCDGKLVLFLSKDRMTKGIRCAQISLERRHHQGRSEIWVAKVLVTLGLLCKLNFNVLGFLLSPKDRVVVRFSLLMEDSLRMSSKTRLKKEQSSEQPSLIPSLPEEIIVDILARVGRCRYPKLSLVSKHFRSLVTSHELYERRSLLGCTEHSLYVVLCNKENDNHYCYVLYRKANGNHSLVLIPSLPKMPRKGGFVAVGSRIYVFGGLNSYRHKKIQTNAISIDCISQTVHLLPSMNVTMSVSVADIIDGKIYVTGYRCNMAVFNTETQMWEPKTIPETMNGYMWACDCVVMAGKMYMRDPVNSFVFVYESKEIKWEMDKMLNKFEWKDACVVDDVLYYYDSGWKVLRAYDPKESSWVVVNGLAELLADARFSAWSYTGSYGGKLAMFYSKITGKTKVIRCAEISLERRRQGKKIWGKVEWCDDVLVGGDFYVNKSLDVIV
ncbi:hypothetical protein HID58_017664 [Brassica napus]|uniref:F-box domain-containing protein n=3 Tax=Brassica napus TaxID=3708 RepID=A0ABQ8D7R7_BRANA|nr:hypothetical protein HID58_017664 [Brassica napus]